MADRLTEAFNALRAGGATFAGRVRITGWSDSSRGMLGTFRLDASADPLDNPATHPFKGAHCSPKDGHEFMLLVIPVASEEAKPAGQPATETPPAPAAEPERRRITDLPFSQRAAMLAQDKLFYEFLRDRHPNYITPTEETDFAATPADAADRALKALCRIDSKRDLNTDYDAAARFDRLSRAFWQWKQEPVSPSTTDARK